MLYVIHCGMHYFLTTNVVEENRTVLLIINLALVTFIIQTSLMGTQLFLTSLSAIHCNHVLSVLLLLKPGQPKMLENGKRRKYEFNVTQCGADLFPISIESLGTGILESGQSYDSENYYFEITNVTGTTLNQALRNLVNIMQF